MFRFKHVKHWYKAAARIVGGGCPSRQFPWIHQLIIKFAKYSDVHFTNRLTEIQATLCVAVTYLLYGAESFLRS
jgi:hypothetical protein